MTPRNPFWPKHAFAFKMGGGAPAGPMPAPPAPPASTSDVAVTQQKADAKRLAQKKQGVNSTILSAAPEAGPAAGAAGSPGKNTVLGGG